MSKLIRCLVLTAAATLGAAPFSFAQVGDIAGVFMDNSGQPLEGLRVVLNSLDRVEVTDAEGNVFFANVPAGDVSIGLRKTFLVIEPDGSTTENEAFINEATVLRVQPAQVNHIEGLVDVPVTVARLACGTVPWCMLGGVRRPGMGAWTVTGGTGVVGPCPCASTSSANIGGVGCPGAAVVAGPLPPPGVWWSLSSNTCIGPGPACAPPVVTTAPACNITF